MFGQKKIHRTVLWKWVGFFLFIPLLSLCLGLGSPLYAHQDAQPSEIPPYIRLIDPDDTIPPLTDEEFVQQALSVNFSVSTARICADDPSLRALFNEVIPLAKRNGWTLRSMAVRGGASPDGPYKGNARLCRQRADALLGLLGRYLDLPDKGIEVSHVPEDYDYLCRLMAAANDPDHALVADLVHEHIAHPALLKTSLQQVRHGELWERIKTDYFPALRAARVVIFFARAHEASRATAADTLSQLSDRVPSYIKVIRRDSLIPTYDVETFYRDALHVGFKIDKTHIPSSHPALQRIVSEAVPLIRDQNLQFHHMDVRGGASPEGPYWNNVRLSRQRANALVDSLRRYIDIPAGKVEMVQVAEDYDYLCRLMRDAADADYDRVQALVQQHTGDAEATKAALQALDGGQVWQRLYRTYFPQLRSARVIFYFTLRSLEGKITKLEVPAGAVLDQPVVDYPLHIESPQEREPMLSVKTNLLYDVLVMPGIGLAPAFNVKLEYYPRNSRWTIAAEYDFPWWKHEARHEYFQILNWQVDARRYFRHDGTHTRHYLYGYLMANLYDISFDAERAWQGEGMGLGVGYGYAIPLGRKSPWKLDLHVQVGYLLSNYDSYHAGSPYAGKYYYDWYGPIESFKRRNHRLHYFGPTGIGATISYDLLWRNKKKNNTNTHGYEE